MDEKEFYSDEPEEDEKEPGGCTGVMVGCGVLVVFLALAFFIWLVTKA